MQLKILQTTTKGKIHISTMIDGETHRYTADWDEDKIQEFREMWKGDKEDKALCILMLEALTGYKLVPKNSFESIPTVKV